MWRCKKGDCRTASSILINGAVPTSYRNHDPCVYYLKERWSLFQCRTTFSENLQFLNNNQYGSLTKHQPSFRSTLGWMLGSFNNTAFPLHSPLWYPDLLCSLPLLAAPSPWQCPCGVSPWQSSLSTNNHTEHDKRKSTCGLLLQQAP